MGKTVLKNKKIYTKVATCTFSSGYCTITEPGVDTDTKVLVCRNGEAYTSLTFGALVQESNKIHLSAYNCQGNGAPYSGTSTITLLICKV